METRGASASGRTNLQAERDFEALKCCSIDLHRIIFTQYLSAIDNKRKKLIRVSVNTLERESREPYFPREDLSRRVANKLQTRASRYIEFE